MKGTTKPTLPPIVTTVALYVFAIAAGVLISKEVALWAAVAATVVLLYVGASYEHVQRHLPDLGRLPYVRDHGLHTKAREGEKPKAVKPTTPEAVRTEAVVVPSRTTRPIVSRDQAHGGPKTQLSDALALLREQGIRLRDRIDPPAGYLSTSVSGMGTIFTARLETEARTWARRGRRLLEDNMPRFLPEFDQGQDLPQAHVLPLVATATKAELLAFLAHKLAVIEEATIEARRLL